METVKQEREDQAIAECPYCREYDNRPDGVGCCMSSNGSYLCTRQANHDGPHAACGFNPKGHPYHTWESKE